MFGMGGTILLEGLERLLGISRSDASEDFFAALLDRSRWIG